MATKKISELSTYTESSISDATQALVPLDDLTVVGTGKTKHMSFAEQAKWFGSRLPKLVVNPGVALTASAPFTLSQNWNNNAVTFEGVKIVIDDDASAAASLPFQVLGGAAGATNLANVNKVGVLSVRGYGGGALGGLSSDSTELAVHISSGASLIGRLSGAQWSLVNTVALSNQAPSSPDVFLTREAANHLALRNVANAQNFSVYNTYTSPSVYERGRFGWNGSNVLQIGTEHVGGVARDLSFITNGVSRGTFNATTGRFDISAGLAIVTGNIAWYSGTSIGTPSDGIIKLSNSADNDFGRLQLGGTTNAFPSIARSGANIQIKLADNSVLTGLEASVVLAGNGTSANPSFAFTNAVGGGCGFKRDAGGTGAIFCASSAEIWRSAASSINMRSNGAFCWMPGSDFGEAADLYMVREAANHLALRNSTNAQSFSVYGSYTSGSVYNRLRTYYDGTNYNIAAEHVGSSYGSIQFLTNGALSLQVGSTGTVYVPNALLLQTYIQWNGKGAIEQPTDGIFLFGNSSAIGGVLQLTENTAPSAPSANNVRIYAEDNGSGKTRLMAIFGSGAAQQIAIEP